MDRKQSVLEAKREPSVIIDIRKRSSGETIVREIAAAKPPPTALRHPFFCGAFFFADGIVLWRLLLRYLAGLANLGVIGYWWLDTVD